MKFKWGFIFICLIICLFSIASVCAIEGVNLTQAIESSQSDEINVTDDLKATEDTDNEIMTAEEGSFEQLNGELQGKSHYTLTRDYKYVYDDGDRFARGITLENTITIDGAGHKIDGSGIARIFNVAADNVILKNITFQNGRTTQDGGAVYFASSGSVINCTFADNYAALHGGAIKFSSTGNVTDCNFINNTGYRGGAVFFLMEGIIKNSNFDDNSGRYGGAVFFGDYGEAVNCNFTDNSAFSDDDKAEGGAIIFDKYGAAANCNFVDNVACYYGAIKFEGLGTVTNCNFTRNQGKGGALLFNSFGSLAHCNFVDNVNTEGNGGAVCFALDSECIVENCNFDHNKATGDGGAIWMYFGRLTNCNFTDNQATGNGGAVSFYEQGTLTNCNFANNQVTGSDSYGGAIYFAKNSNGDVANCNFTNNQATGNYSYGGAIYFSSNGNVANCNFTDNNASKYGGAICFDEYSTGSVINCSFTGNTVVLDGGAIYFMNSGTVINCSFADNCALREGGATFIFSSGRVVNSDFKNNTAEAGGAIMFFDDGSVENSNFTNNKATFQGGAVFFKSDGEATNCNFINNSAINVGGAIRFYGRGNVSNSNFTDNSAFNNGGAIYFRDLGNVTDCNFINNNVSEYGGAINFDYIASIASNCIFINNSAGHGGAINFQLESIVSNCIFADNSAENGGAVNFYTSGTAINCNFTGNHAINQGGAVYLNDGDVADCNFINNTADNLGGAIYVYSGSVEGCNFTGNSAECGGAVIFNDRGSGNATNCNFIKNHANSFGGAIYTQNGASDTITNCIFAENNAPNEGGAIYSTVQYTAADTCIFKTETDTTNDNVIILSPTLNVDNFTTVYNSGEKLTLDLKTDSGMSVDNGNISISVYYKNNDTWFDNYSCLSGQGWAVDLPVGSYYAVFNTEYAGFNPIKRTIKVIPDIPYYANVTSLSSNNRTVNITAKSNVPQDIIEGELLFILPNGDVINAAYASGGIWWAVHTFDDYKDYQVNASYIGLDNVEINNATISITKVNSTVNVTDVVIDWGDSKNVTVTAEGATGITAKINDTPVGVIDNFTIPISGLAAGNYTLTVTTIADGDHNNVSKTVNITVNKVESTLTVGNIVFDYEATGSVEISFTGASGVLPVVNDSHAVVNVNETAITVSNLSAGSYVLTVATVPDENHTEVIKTANITVNKINSTLTVDNVTLDYGESFNLTVSTEGTTGVTAKIDGSDVDVIDNYTIPIYGLNPKVYILTVTTVPDANHLAVNRTVTITVKKINSTVNVTDVVLDYGDSTKVTVTTEGATGIMAMIDANPVSVVDNYTILISGLAAGIHTLTVTTIVDGDHNNVTKNATITVNKLKTEMAANPITATYNINRDLVITLKDSKGNVISGAKITVDLNGVKTYTTDVNGQIKVSTKGLVPKVYTAAISYAGDNNYVKSAKEVKVTINKATPKIIAKKKTYKAKSKTKKFKITLKDNTGKPIKNAKVRIIVKKIKKTSKKKSKTKKTNKKGQITFKINIFKKGTYKVTVKFNGNNCYKKTTKTVKIKLK